MPFTVRLQGPLDFALSLDSFSRYGDDGIDRWDGQTLVRTVPLAAGHVAYAATPAGTTTEPALDVSVEREGVAAEVEEAIRATFLPPPAGWHALLQEDTLLARLDARFPGLQPVLQPDLTAALVRSISAQQVNLTWAATTRRRLAERFGERHEVEGWTVHAFSAQRLAGASIEEIRALQFTTRKAEYIVGVAEEIASGRLTLGELAPMSDEDVVRRLTALRGIGRWTAEWILTRTLGRPVVVAGDLGVRKAVGLAYLGKADPSETEVRRATAHWGEEAAMAQALILRGLSRGVLVDVAAQSSSAPGLV